MQKAMNRIQITVRDPKQERTYQTQSRDHLPFPYLENSLSFLSALISVFPLTRIKAWCRISSYKSPTPHIPP